MILLYVLSTFVLLCYGQNAELEFKEKCSKVGDTLTIEAVYTGSGTPQLITWTYSGFSLSGDTSGCSLLGTPPAGFPDTSRLSFICVSTNTYQLEVSDFQANESDKTWAVTFTPPVGTAPAAVQETVPSICSSTTSTTLSTSTFTTNTNMTNIAASTNPSATNFSTVKSPVTDESMIIGFSVGGVIILIVILSIIICICVRKNKEKNKKKYVKSEKNTSADIVIDHVGEEQSNVSHEDIDFKL